MTSCPASFEQASYNQSTTAPHHEATPPPSGIAPTDNLADVLTQAEPDSQDREVQSCLVNVAGEENCKARAVIKPAGCKLVPRLRIALTRHGATSTHISGRVGAFLQ
jgi:hypothetical protein